MSLPLPVLDDRPYDSLIEEARGLIPAYAPEWTNHNPSDPGITLIELFAWFAEMLIYRLDRVTEANIRAFLRLLNGPEWTPTPGDTLQDQIRKTVLDLRRPQRAITMSDFEALARLADPAVARAHALPSRNLEVAGAARYSDQPGHVSVIIVPGDATLIAKVFDYLDRRRLLATALHVVAPQYLKVSIQATVVLKPQAQAQRVQRAAISAMHAFLDPLTGGQDGRGWPFGRSLYVSDIYRILDSLTGVDCVQKTLDKDGKTMDELRASDASRLQRKDGDLVLIRLQPDELLVVETINVTVQYPGKVKP